MKLPKLVIFDFDGVIADTAPIHFKAWYKVFFDYFGIEIDEIYLDKFRGIKREKCLEILLKDYKIDIDKIKFSFNEIVNKKNYIYLETLSDKNALRVFQGTINLIKKLYNKNIKLALASASKNSERMLDTLKLTKYFSYITNPDEVAPKPDPEIFIKPYEVLKIDPKDCWGVEDSQAGITSINKANIFSIGIGDRQLLAKANIIFNNLDEIDINKIIQAYNLK
ncbi:HAD family hydrolase [Spiroplasma floricola]|uniref:Beta-phosphoglucomutase n=1 Tax=Spiroplasma floricola 23-6 TaxID=1336749 RepID=A0A2K8SEY3_9MOLU|nr:HAD-IA family hydrolase [Spiroplasma floricola]AUB31915.1 beta-phosphoglucomutase [Spiroplasma floricola 23-6]